MRRVLVSVMDNDELQQTVAPEQLASMICAVLQGGYVLARAQQSPEPFGEAVTGAVALLSMLARAPVAEAGGEGSEHERAGGTVTLIGGPTALLELGGVRFLTDPTFDPPGSYEPRPGVHLTETASPAVTAAELPPVDVVLLPHDHHKDNLDDNGRQFLVRVRLILTTVSGAERLGEWATPLANRDSVQIERGDGAGTIDITGLPAQHGPDGSEHLVGDATGSCSCLRADWDEPSALSGRAGAAVKRMSHAA